MQSGLDQLGLIPLLESVEVVEKFDSFIILS